MSEILLKNARVWPDAYSEVLEGFDILVRDNLIYAVGPNLQTDGEVIDARGALAMPGFIHTHIHCCQTLFRGIAEDLPLLPWLRNYIWPMEAAHDPETLRTSALLSAAELIRGGTCAFLSMETVRHTEAVFEALDEVGLIGQIGHCLMDATGGCDALATDPADSLKQCERLLEQWGNHPRLRPAVAPRFVLSCSESAMRDAATFARDHGLLLHTHASEQLEEIELVRSRTGKWNIEYLHEIGYSGPDVCLAHAVHTQDHERRLLAEQGTRVLHCPSANLKLGSGIAPVPEYLQQGISVSLGADGAPCNNRLDLFMEMREAALIQKPRLGPDALSARDTVHMATQGAAEALGWGPETGRLEAGSRANVILLAADSLHAVPDDAPASRVVYSGSAEDVQLNMVDGRILYRDGAFLTLDIERILQEARQARSVLEQRAGLRGAQ